MGGCLIENATRRLEILREVEMGRQIKLITRRELTSVIRLRYEAADRSSKKTILDEFVKVTGYHRKHAIRILTTEIGGQPKPRVGCRIYQQAVKEALIVLWEASDRICGKRLKASLPLLVTAMERHGHLQLDDGVKKHVQRQLFFPMDDNYFSLRTTTTTINC